MRDITITCNGSLVCDSRSTAYGITSGTLKLGIDDTIPQLEFTISPEQAGYDAVALGGDVKVWFAEPYDNVLMFRGRLDEIDTDSSGNRTIVANGDISRLKDGYITYLDYDAYWSLSGGYMPDEIFKKFNNWSGCSSVAGSVPFSFAMNDNIGATDTIFCPSVGATAFECLNTMREAFADKSVHYYCLPTEADTRVIQFVVGTKVNAAAVSGWYELQNVMAVNPQILEYGRNITSISIEQERPDATVYYHTGTDSNGDHVDISTLESGPYMIFKWKGTAQDAVSTYGKSSSPETETYGFIYKKVDVGQVHATGTAAKEAVYNILIKNLGYSRHHPTITVEGVDMYYVDGSADAISPYNLIRVVSPLHGIDEYFTINSITYNLMNAADTKISVGAEQALITR